MVIAPISLAFFLFRALLKNTVEAEYFAQAERVGQGITEELKKRSAYLAHLAETFSNDKHIIQSLSNNDRTGLEKRLVEIFKYSYLDLLEVGNPEGFVSARGHRPGEYGEAKAAQSLIKNAVSGEAGADIEYGASGIALRAVVPIMTSSGKLLGTMMTGVLLDKSFFDSYKTITGFDIALYEGKTLIANTYGAPIGWLPAGDYIRNPGVGKAVFNINKKEMWGVYLPVYHLAGSLFGGLLLWQGRDAILQPLHVNQLTLMLTFLIAIILAIMLAVFLSKNFSSPLKKMLPVMDMVSKGDMNVDIPTTKWREFHELSKHFQDMLSEIKKAHEKIINTQHQLIVAAKLAVLGQVTAELAHEVRNPLNSMEINLRLLKDLTVERMDGEPEMVEKIERLHAEIKRLKQTVQDFVEAGGKITLRKVPLDITEETKAVIKLAQPQIELLGLRLNIHLKETEMVYADRNRFHQAVLNLLLNACQSMKPGGTLTVRSEETEEKVSLVIRDTGVGMTREKKERIFDFPFTSKPDGTGCGLSYVLRIIQAHKGEFDIDSEPDVGTTVRISFVKQRGMKKHEKSIDNRRRENRV
jgi:signal transduction histidine kinase